MIIRVATLALITQLTVTVADGVPRLNVEPVCRGIAQQGGLDLEPNQSARRDFKSCIKSEMVIRSKLVARWSSFRASDRANCIGEATAGGQSSYTDLLTCLQMARDASKLGD